MRLYASEQEEQAPSLNEENTPNPGWVQVLTEECRELRESNIQLQDEADKLRKETVDVELKEKELVQQCLEQFSKLIQCIPLRKFSFLSVAEAKRRLGELREESEQKQNEIHSLQVDFALSPDILFHYCLGGTWKGE